MSNTNTGLKRGFNFIQQNVFIQQTWLANLSTILIGGSHRAQPIRSFLTSSAYLVWSNHNFWDFKMFAQRNGRRKGGLFFYLINFIIKNSCRKQFQTRLWKETNISFFEIRRKDWNKKNITYLTFLFLN